MSAIGNVCLSGETGSARRAVRTTRMLNGKCRNFRYVTAIAATISVSYCVFYCHSQRWRFQTIPGCCLGLILIKLSSVAAAIITRMPARLSAICIASPSEMSTSAMWLASASRTPRQ
jgi:hypothetical protein